MILLMEDDELLCDVDVLDVAKILNKACRRMTLLQCRDGLGNNHFWHPPIHHLFI